MPERPLKVAWIPSFPVEWLPDVPEPLRNLPRLHPATWQRVLLDEFSAIRSRMPLELHIFSVGSHYEGNCRFERNGVTFHCLRTPRGMRTLSLFWWETWLFGSRLKTIKPDLVHAWGTERGGALVASRLGYPYLVTMQGLLEWYSQNVRLGRYHQLDTLLEPLALRRASVATTESTFAVNWLRERYPELEVIQTEHAPNWLFHQLERQPETRRPIRFLFVGVLSLIKGTDLLLQALDKLRGELDFRLTIIGEPRPEFAGQLKAWTSSQLWERVTLRQGLNQEQVAHELAEATMLLFPTRVDTSPNSVKEAVVAGVPVVASAIGGIVDYVVPERNGLTFPAGNLEEFIKAIRTAIAHPLFGQGIVEPETRDQMRQYLSPRVMAEGFWGAYQKVVAKAKSAGHE
jgi:glycosyltransferase involved in cell wall biosynthesis